MSTMTAMTPPAPLPTPTRTGLLLFGAGLIGVASLLTVHFPTGNLPREVIEKISPTQLRLLMLVNPLLLLIISVVTGSFLHQKVGLVVFRRTDFRWDVAISNVLRNGIIPGIAAGLLILGVVFVFQRLIPAELARLGNGTGMTALARFLYGGVTEEIMVRFGLMTLFVWLLRAVFRTRAPIIYWVANGGAAILFGVGHLPAMQLMIANPSTLLVLYILIGNALAGIVFGWIYWRHGLVFAMIAHVAAHVVLLTFDFITG